MKTSKLLGLLFKNEVFISRGLLKECSTSDTLMTSRDARKLLMNIVGSPKNYGDKVEMQQAAKLASKQSDLPTKHMLDSYREMIIPLAKEPKQRDKYIFSENSLRFGRFFEDLDTLAVLICYSHIRDPSMTPDQKSPVSIVTAMVDSLNTKTDQISPDKDIMMRGHVTWVGGSSMEVTISMEQENNGKMNQVISANFLMVARDPVAKKKAYVNGLEASTPEEQALLDLGEAHKKARNLQNQVSVLKLPPSEAERLVIHDLFLKNVDKKNGTINDQSPPSDTIWMSNAGLKNVLYCFPEKRNLYHKVFGGYLMRQALELAQSNALSHCKCDVGLAYVDDISFQQPVEIGTILFLSSKIIYTYKQMLQLRVHAQVLNPLTGDSKTTNTFQFTFRSTKTFLHVMPRKYSEYLLYIEGKRHMDTHL